MDVCMRWVHLCGCGSYMHLPTFVCTQSLAPTYFCLVCKLVAVEINSNAIYGSLCTSGCVLGVSRSMHTMCDGRCPLTDLGTH
jgi:hypothetical protein